LNQIYAASVEGSRRTPDERIFQVSFLLRAGASVDEREGRAEIQLEDLLIYPAAFNPVVAGQADCNGRLSSGPHVRVSSFCVLNPDGTVAGKPAVEVTWDAAHECTSCGITSIIVLTSLARLA
jgi:hypothetical protein